jgi:hypothetical protein
MLAARGLEGAGRLVLVHEMVVPPEIRAMEASHFSRPAAGTMRDNTVKRLARVQDSSHTPQGAFGYLEDGY